MLELGFGPEQLLCMDLLRADTEQEVIDILTRHGYWDDPSVWQAYGNKEGNFSTIGSQADNPESALVEKLVNSIDAVLTGECWVTGIRPYSPEAPRTISEAVSSFIHGEAVTAQRLRHISEWSKPKRLKVSERITLAATGTLQKLGITIVDNGEGQTPNAMPETLLSLDKENKVNIHFVQGKFNMGGTAVFRFCGYNNLQLVISRRNPNIKLDAEQDPSFSQWGFTIVRRENPPDNRRLSTYKYLAPHSGGVLRFEADVLPLFPQGNNAYVRNTEWGTAIKLYEYNITGRSNILLRSGLLRRLDLFLPEPALPIRLHECRKNYKGNPGSFANTLAGIRVRLNDDRNENLESGFPTSSNITIGSESISVEIYAFKRGKADTYRKQEGIIFAVNGQTHGSIAKNFFRRKDAGTDRLEDSLLVILDCTRISRRGIEDLFMNSRDRVQQGHFLEQIKDDLASILKDHPDLRALRERRRSEDISSRLENSKPFEDILTPIINKSPVLARLFGGIGRLPNPIKPDHVKRDNGFEPKPHPSYFRFSNKNYGETLSRTTPINMRSRIVFETDVVNDYFTRDNNPGEHILFSLNNKTTPDHTLNLYSGTATLNVRLPEGANIGDSYTYEFIVRDDTLFQPFSNRFVITAGKHQDSCGGKGQRRRRSTPPQGLAIPTVNRVYEEHWSTHQFDKYSALRVVHNPSDEGEDLGTYDYYINMDNVYLKSELKATKEDTDILNARWEYGIVLIGMALLREDSTANGDSVNGQRPEEDGGLSVQEMVGNALKAIAPFLLPIIEHLGALSDDDV